MKINNTITNDHSSIAKSFNDYFSSIGPNLANRIPQTEKSFVHYLKNRYTDTLFFIPTDTEEIIDVEKSKGFDDISNDLLQQITNEIAIPLEHVINLSIVNGIVPDKMKIAKVIPIHKKGDPLSHSHTIATTSRRPLTTSGNQPKKGGCQRSATGCRYSVTVALDISNYRPISLLSSISKVLEKIIHKRTIRF